MIGVIAAFITIPQSTILSIFLLVQYSQACTKPKVYFHYGIGNCWPQDDFLLRSVSFIACLRFFNWPIGVLITRTSVASPRASASFLRPSSGGGVGNWGWEWQASPIRFASVPNTMILSPALMCSGWYKGWNLCLRTFSFQQYAKWRFAVCENALAGFFRRPECLLFSRRFLAVNKKIVGI